MKNIKINGIFWIQAFAFVTACLLLFALFLNFSEVMEVISRFFRIISPFIVGTVIAYFLSGPCNSIENLLNNERLKRSRFRFLSKGSRGLSVFIVYILTIVIIVIVSSLFVPLIVQNVIEFIQNIPQILIMIENWIHSLDLDSLNEFMNIEEAIHNLFQAFTLSDVLPYLTAGMTNIHGIAMGTASGVLDAVVAFVISIYTLLYRKNIFRFLNWVAGILIKEKRLITLKEYILQAHDLFYRFIRAQFLDACIMAVLSLILLSVLGVRYAITLAFFLGLCNMIPKFGSIFGTIVVIILSFINGGGTQALLVAVLLTTLQQIDGNIIGPKIMGKALKINPILVFLALVIGGAYFGIIGMFISIPVMVMIKIIFMNVMEARELKIKPDVIDVDEKINE